MIGTVRRLVVVAACLATSVLVGATPAVAGWPTIGKLKVSATGVPASLNAGGTINLTMYYSQNSHDTLNPIMFGLEMWNMAAPGTGQSHGVTVSWLNPLTQAWQASTGVDGNGTWTLDISTAAQKVLVKPNTTAAVHLRITLSGSAYHGTYHVQPSPALSYTMLTAAGVDDPAILDYEWPQYTFAFGTAAASSPHTGRPTPTATSKPRPRASTRTPAVPPSAPPSPMAPAAAGLSTQWPTIDAAPPSLAVVTVDLAADRPAARATWWYLGVAVLALLAAGAAGYLIRLRRATATDATPTDATPADATPTATDATAAGTTATGTTATDAAKADVTGAGPS
jgi:hypothetical protein